MSNEKENLLQELKRLAAKYKTVLADKVAMLQNAPKEQTPKFSAEEILTNHAEQTWQRLVLFSKSAKTPKDIQNILDDLSQFLDAVEAHPAPVPAAVSKVQVKANQAYHSLIAQRNGQGERIAMPKTTDDAKAAPAESKSSHTWNLSIEHFLPETIVFQLGKVTQEVKIIDGEDEPKIWTTTFKTATLEALSAKKRVVRAAIVGKDMKGTAVSTQQQFEIETTTTTCELVVKIRWYGDGEKEFPIIFNGRVSNDSERGAPSYWANNLLSEIEDETGADLSQSKTATAQFVDGDKGFFPFTRRSEGIKQAKIDAFAIFDKLGRDPKTGKITQKIQIYAHSRGSAFANGYVEELQNQAVEYNKKYKDIFADIANLVDIVIHLDAHQASSIHVKIGNHPTTAIAHGNWIADSNLTGDVLGVNNPSGFVDALSLASHKNETFVSDVDKILDQHNRNEFSPSTDKYEGFLDALKPVS